MLDLGSADDFTEGQPKLFSIEGREIAVVKWRDSFYATASRCPHMAAPLVAGIVGPKLSAGHQLGSIEADAKSPMLGCPWHGWQFDLTTGQSVWDATYRIRTYPVECQDGRVRISVRPRKGGGRK